MEILDLSLKGFEEWKSTPLSRPNSQTVNDLDVWDWDHGHGRELRMAWTTELDTDLLHIAAIIQQSQKLRTLRIQATSELHPLLTHLLDRRDYLFQSTIRALLSASNLTSLELDLCGTRFIPQQSQEHVEESHICTTIAALLTTLRCLRLRMRSLCPDILQPGQHSVNLRLNEVLINLSLNNESPLIISAAHATRCGSSSQRGFLRLKANMKKQSQLLVAQMAAPKIVRILTYAPNREMKAFDVLTGRNVTLNEGADWDDDGETIESGVSDEESEILRLSSDSSD